MKTIRNTAFLLLLASAAAAGDWGGFRNTTGSAVADESTLPVKWSKDEGVRYKVELPGRGLSNPVIAAGRVYVTACSGYRETRLHVICLDEATGQKVWERQFAATGNTGCHPVSNMAAPTPVTDGRVVYALFATGDLAAISRDGDLLWYRSIVGDYPAVSNQVGMASSPVLAGNALCLQMDSVGESFIAGLDKKTGKNLWKLPREKSINWTTPIVLDSGLVLFQNGDEATAVEPNTGKVRWKLKGGWSTIPSPTSGDGAVFLTGGRTLKAVKPKQGSEAPEELWEGGAVVAGYASPVYHKDHVYGLTAAAVVCLSAKDGSEVWRQRVDGPFDGSPVIANNKLYALNNKGRMSVFELGDKPTLIAKNDIDDKFQATPAIANGCIYLRSDKYLYCIGPKR
ncbi:MAG: PQQ-binding-like beta-propeller repeat protein [Gemmataceae bacterium]